MKPKVCPALLEAVEAGVRYGLRRAFKHNSSPAEPELISVITDSVMTEMFERFEIPVDSPTQND